MAEYDLIIRNGTIVDGTGGIPAYRGDIAIKQGKIAMISGRIKATANKEVDATGCVVAPGAIDLHNHYDLQLNWDPYATMSGWHGVTSVAIGQCGFGFAPCKPKGSKPRCASSLASRQFPSVRWNRVCAGTGKRFPSGWTAWPSIPWGSMSVPSCRPTGWRLYVMGIDNSRERVLATEAETRQMQALVREAMAAGAFGWSSMKTLINRPDDGRFIPSQVASNEEYLALAQVLSEFGVGSIGWTRGATERPLPPGEPDLLGGDTTPSGSGIRIGPGRRRRPRQRSRGFPRPRCAWQADVRCSGGR